MAIDFSTVPSPCFILDEDLLRNNLKKIKDVSTRSGAEIILAFKGFAMWSVFPLIREYISGAAASSLNEARLCFEEMHTEAHTYAPAFSEKEFPKIIRFSSHITFNSLNQFERFYPIIKRSGKKISVGLRVNPEFSSVSTALYNPCSPGSRLGVTADVIGNTLPEEIEGLHIHALCESTSYDLENLLEVFIKKFSKFFSQLKWINLGGGHLMTQKDYNREHLIKILQNFKQKSNLHIILEPGSAFAWETGYLKSTILDIVENKDISTAILDVSFTAHMPDCLEMPYKPEIMGATDPSQGKFSYRMGGNSCLSGDFLGNWGFDNQLTIGNPIIFKDMIHYTMVKTNTFNGVAHPAIALWRDNRFDLIKTFGYKDFKNRLS